MKNIGLWLMGLVTVIICGCAADDDKGIYIVSDSYDFSQDLHGWETDFAYYSVTKSATDSGGYNLSSEYTSLPENLGYRKAIKVSGTNVDGKLFMYLRKKISGFKPNTDYTMALEVELASNARAGSSEGENVYLKAGAFYMEPKKVIEKDTYTLNIDTGNLNSAGEGVMLLGSIGTNSSNGYSDSYTLATYTSNTQQTAYHIRSNSQGELWLLVGTDSGFLGTTTLFYTKISFILSASN